MSRSIVALKRRDVPATGPVADFLEVADTMGEKRGGAPLSPTLATEFENLQLIDLFTCELQRGTTSSQAFQHAQAPPSLVSTSACQLFAFAIRS